MKHGLTGTPEFNTYRAMRNQCLNPSNKYYKYYGGRGVRICQEWLDDPRAFVDHVGLKPSPKHSLDRIDTNGNYEPGNVRWATEFAQKRNTRANVWLEAHGKRQTITDWSLELGLACKTIKHRIHVLGWALDKALSPERHAAGRPKILLTHNGKTLCLKEWAHALGLSPATLTLRMKRGLPVDQVLARAGG